MVERTYGDLYGTDSYAPRYEPEKGFYQRDDRIFHQPGFFYDSVQRVTEVAVIPHGLLAHLTLESGEPATLRLKVWQSAAAVISRYIIAPPHLKSPAFDHLRLDIYPGAATRTPHFQESRRRVDIAYENAAGQGMLTLRTPALTYTPNLFGGRHSALPPRTRRSHGGSQPSERKSPSAAQGGFASRLPSVDEENPVPLLPSAERGVCDYLMKT